MRHRFCGTDRMVEPLIWNKRGPGSASSKCESKPYITQRLFRASVDEAECLREFVDPSHPSSISATEKNAFHSPQYSAKLTQQGLKCEVVHEITNNSMKKNTEKVEAQC